MPHLVFQRNGNEVFNYLKISTCDLENKTITIVVEDSAVCMGTYIEFELDLDELKLLTKWITDRIEILETLPKNING